MNLLLQEIRFFVLISQKNSYFCDKYFSKPKLNSVQMGFRFNSRGFLMPYQKINSSIEEIQDVFVEQQPYSETRRLIFDNYLAYLVDFKRYITPNFTHWLDGSFTSLKPNPNDLDFVSFIDYRIYEAKEDEIFRIVEKYGYLKLDNYISQVFPESHLRHSETLHYMDYWKDLFSSSRRDADTNLQAPRGFIEIIFKS
jgi:hypothetical protein